eukprot:5019320-Prymnesium_polylepis.1
MCRRRVRSGKPDWLPDSAGRVLAGSPRTFGAGTKHVPLAHAPSALCLDVWNEPFTPRCPTYRPFPVTYSHQHNRAAAARSAGVVGRGQQD